MLPMKKKEMGTFKTHAMNEFYEIAILQPGMRDGPYGRGAPRQQKGRAAGLSPPDGLR